MIETGTLIGSLDEIDWSSLSDAYGPAHRVPAFLRDAASDDEAVRGAAFDGLFSHVWHQGTVYEVTATAVPFIAALAGGTGKDRGDLFELLRLIRLGRADSDQHAGYETPETFASEAWQSKAARERRWVEAARVAVEAVLPLARRTAHNPAEDELVRWQAAWLWWVLEAPPATELNELARTAPPLVLAGLILLGADLGVDPTGDPLPRIAAVISASRRALDADLVRQALELLPEAAPAHLHWRRLPHTHPRGPAMSLLLPIIHSGQAFADIVTPTLTRLLPTLPPGPAEVAASAGIFLVWGVGTTAPVREVQAMFGAIAASAGVWATPQHDMLSSYALPATREGLAELAVRAAPDVAALRVMAASG